VTREERHRGAGFRARACPRLPGESSMPGPTAQTGGYPEPFTVVSLSAEHIRPDNCGRSDASAVPLFNDESALGRLIHDRLPGTRSVGLWTSHHSWTLPAGEPMQSAEHLSSPSRPAPFAAPHPPLRCSPSAALSPDHSPDRILSHSFRCPGARTRAPNPTAAVASSCSGSSS
jgi:hypothetical protein